MPHKAFLKKKSLLDRFKDDYATHTGYIQSARAKHTWNNPLTRRKRTKELNRWIKSFAGKNHIHKLSRFNAINAGKNEDYADGVKCLRYGSSFELPDGKIITALDKAIRCRRSGAFIVYITGWVENEGSDPCNSKYTVYFDTGKYEDYFLTNDIQYLPNYQTNGPIPSDNKVIKDYAMHENTNEAMSLKGFLENLTEKLTKQFDLDADDVKFYLDTHTQEMQELLDDKELSLKEKVLFVRSEITGEKDEAKKSERLFNKREMERITLSEGSKVSPYLVEIAHKILTDEYGWKASTIEEVADWLGDHKQAFEHAYGQALRSSDDDKANVKSGIEAALDEEERGVMNAEIAMMGESKEPANEKLGYEKGHKNSKGEDAPWVIRSHEDNRVLASFAKKEDAEAHLKRMKQYSKTEKKSEAVEESDFIKDFRARMESMIGEPYDEDDILGYGWVWKSEDIGYPNGNKTYYEYFSLSDDGVPYTMEIGYNSFNETISSFKMWQEASEKKSEASNLAGYTSDIVSELDTIWGCGEDGAKRLVGKYADVIQQNYVDGDLLASETAKFIAGQEHLTESHKKSESKKSEGRLELVDTVIVPKWLWEAYNFGNDYGEDLDEHEQEILARFQEKYSDLYLDDHDEEADFHSRNDFDEYGGPCYEVDVYEMKKA